LTDKGSRIGVDDALLGRMIDSLGAMLDSGGALSYSAYRLLNVRSLSLICPWFLAGD
jgi:flagellar biosynthesis/type III secretory pathway ATPase